MREIKFRGRRPDTKEWVYGLPIPTHIGTYIVTEENPHVCTQYGYMEIDQLSFVEDKTIGQFVRKDCDGKDIYEGDILETTGGYRHVVVFSHVHHTWGVVTAWEYNQYRNTIQNGVPFYEHMATPPAKEDWFDFVQARVIGNIYDNPKLTE